MSDSSLFPCLYIAHGGGPLPLLNQQNDVADFLKSYPNTITTPDAIVGKFFN